MKRQLSTCSSPLCECLRLLLLVSEICVVHHDAACLLTSLACAYLTIVLPLANLTYSLYADIDHLGNAVT